MRSLGIEAIQFRMFGEQLSRPRSVLRLRVMPKLTPLAAELSKMPVDYYPLSLVIHRDRDK